MTKKKEEKDGEKTYNINHAAATTEKLTDFIHLQTEVKKYSNTHC